MLKFVTVMFARCDIIASSSLPRPLVASGLVVPLNKGNSVYLMETLSASGLTVFI